jgi:hypothetical protein
MPVPGRPVFPRSFGCVCSGAFPVRFDHVPSRPASSCPCQPSLADRPPSGPGWLHEIKFDGYRVIACKNGERVRLWARTTSDYSNTFTRIRDAVAALPVDSAVLDGEAIVLRTPITDVRPEPLEARRKRLAKLLARKTKAIRHGIQISEAITGDWGSHLSSCVLDGPRKPCLEARRLALRERPDASMAEDEDPGH